MKQIRDASLKHLNSFSVEAKASQLLVLETKQDLQTYTSQHRFNPENDLVLGGGSNVLFASNVEGTLVLNRITGKNIIADSDNEVLLEAYAGENWHQLVLWSLEQGLSGLENLSLIPGLAGAAPMQNIGAYGVELSEILESVQALELNSGELREFSHSDCHFSYRDSRFKSTDAGKYLITRIRLRLQRVFVPQLSYAGLTEELDVMGINTPTAKQVSDAVIRIRQRKLPDPRLLGNAGSFFKNPVVKQKTVDSLRKDFPGLVTFPVSPDTCKLSAAWLIEHCGWKGKSMGRAAVSNQHALVLVNTGSASGGEILALAVAVGKSVQDRFGIKLESEPHIIQPSTNHSRRPE